MSGYINEVRRSEETAQQKPLYRQYALVWVDEEHIDEFDRMMTERNNRWDGRVVHNLDGTYYGWISYTARGANANDVTRTDTKDSIASFAVIVPIERVLIWNETDE